MAHFANCLTNLRGSGSYLTAPAIAFCRRHSCQWRLSQQAAYRLGKSPHAVCSSVPVIETVPGKTGYWAIAMDDMTVGGDVDTEIDLDRDVPGFGGTMDMLEDLVDSVVGEPEFLGVK